MGTEEKSRAARKMGMRAKDKDWEKRCLERKGHSFGEREKEKEREKSFEQRLG